MYMYNINFIFRNTVSYRNWFFVRWRNCFPVCRLAFALWKSAHPEAQIEYLLHPVFFKNVSLGQIVFVFSELISFNCFLFWFLFAWVHRPIGHFSTFGLAKFGRSCDTSAKYGSVVKFKEWNHHTCRCGQQWPSSSITFDLWRPLVDLEKRVQMEWASVTCNIER